MERIDAMALIAHERARQVQKEGFTPFLDDAYNNGELLKAAECYLQTPAFDAREGRRETIVVPPAWPWDPKWWKPRDKLQNLVRAGALVLAEKDRWVRGNMPNYGSYSIGRVMTDLAFTENKILNELVLLPLIKAEPKLLSEYTMFGQLLGTHVRKVNGGDYAFNGQIVSSFKNIKGAKRVVVENNDGILLVFNPEELEIVT